MADEARHVAFGALSLAGVYDDMTSGRAAASARTSWWRRRGCMRDRFLATDVWERLGIPLDDGLLDSQPLADAPALPAGAVRQDHAEPPQDRAAVDDDLTGRLVAIGAMAPEEI